jgi:hypothetical protein
VAIVIIGAIEAIACKKGVEVMTEKLINFIFMVFHFIPSLKKEDIKSSLPPLRLVLRMAGK